MDRNLISRRQVLTGGAVALGTLLAEAPLGLRFGKAACAAPVRSSAARGPGWASPREAMKASREEFLYVSCNYAGTGVPKPDFLAVVDVHPDSDTCGRILHRTAMPYVGDELHHFGWQTCSSSNHCTDRERRYLVVPGARSSRVHVLDIKGDPRKPEIARVIEPKEVIKKTGYSRPHTVHCLPGDIMVMSMLGDAEGNAPGGLAVLDAKTFDVLGRWEKEKGDQSLMYDFWYQPRHNVLVTSEWAAPDTFEPGFKLEDVKAGKYGHCLHVWDLKKCAHRQTIDLGEKGLVPLEVRGFHDPARPGGFVAAALSSTLWHWHPKGDGWAADKVVEIEPREVKGWPMPVPGLITDQVLSLDDRYLYCSNWLHGDLRQYDVSDPARPRLKGQVWLGGVLSERRHPNGRKLSGGPQMLQLSLDGRRLYVTNSLYSSWDNQFYPGMESWMAKIDISADGRMRLDPKFFVDFGKARAHETRLPNGDPTSEIWA
jgi:selenium-binding protein 1